MSVLKKFTNHPKSVGETYTEHAGVAAGFGWTMIVGGFASLIHAVFPFWFESTGSRAINHLHEKLICDSREGLLISKIKKSTPCDDEAMTSAEL